MNHNEPLKLIAKDAQDIAVIAAVLQDAIVPTCDMTYREAEKNFVMIVQRFKWDDVITGIPAQRECAEAKDGLCYERALCALDIGGVEAVQFQGLNPNDPAAMLDLLTIAFEAPYLRFVFAGGGSLRLKLADWRLKLKDFGDSWPTPHCPSHAT